MDVDIPVTAVQNVIASIFNPTFVADKGIAQRPNDLAHLRQQHSITNRTCKANRAAGVGCSALLDRKAEATA